MLQLLIVLFLLFEEKNNSGYSGGNGSKQRDNAQYHRKFISFHNGKHLQSGSVVLYYDTPKNGESQCRFFRFPGFYRFFPF